MKRSSAPLCWLLLSMAACSSGAGEARLEGSSLLLITLDTTRADALGCYGGPAWATPSLDELAREGVLFEQARSVAPITLPAHASILTGLFPFEHGVRDNAIFGLPQRVTTVAERLQGAGYATAAVLGSLVLHADYGLGQGFDIYSDVPRRRIESGLHEEERSATEVVDEALRILREPGTSQPFLLWVHFFDPHFPYEPSAEMLAAALEGRPAESFAREALVKRQYQGEVAAMDREIGRLLREVRKRVPRGRLLTAVVADHGEDLWDHGEITHGLQVYDTTIHVPMILHHPALAARRVAQPVSVVDLAPTLEGLLGLAPRPTSGADLTALLADVAEPAAAAAVAAQRPLYFETCLPFYSYRWSPVFGLVEGPLKLIEAPAPELYDVLADPAERRDLHAERREQAAAMRAAFAPLAKRQAAAEPVEPDEERSRALQELGYVGVSAQPRDVQAPVPGRLLPGLLGPREGVLFQERMSRARALAFGPSGQQRFEEAAELMRALIAEDPGNPTLLVHAGTIFEALGLHEEAVATLRRGIGMLESSAARCTLAIALDNLARKEEAVQVLAEGVERNPHHLYLRLQLARFLVETGRAAQALEHLDVFLQEHEDSADEYHRIAEDLRRRAARLAGR